MKLFNKKEQSKEKLVTIKINKKYQRILTLITFDSQNNFSDAINNLLEINNEINNNEIEIAINELCYLRLKNIMYERNFDNFNELFESLLCWVKTQYNYFFKI